MVVADGLAGFAGPATLYRIDPPISGTDHVAVYFREPMRGQKSGQLSVVLATSGGVGFGGRMDAIQGTHVTNEPNHHLALQLAGGYMIVDADRFEGGV